MPDQIATNRRNLIGAALGAGAAAAATPAAALVTRVPGASLTGPYLDLTTPRGAMTMMARLVDISGKTRHGWYDGFAMSVRPGEAVRNLFGVRGMSSSKLLPLPNGQPGYRKLLRELVFYYDLETGKTLDTWKNPFTGEVNRVVHIANNPWNSEIRDVTPPGPSYGGLNTVKAEPRPLKVKFEIQGDRLVFQRHIHLYYKNALDPQKWPRESTGPMVQVSEFFFHNVSLDDAQNRELTGIRNGGSWSRVTPWLPWMLMGQAPGHMMYTTYMAGSENLNDIPEPILSYAREHYPIYLTPPEAWSEPSLSSIEVYARDETPAPPKPR